MILAGFEENAAEIERLLGIVADKDVLDEWCRRAETYVLQRADEYAWAKTKPGPKDAFDRKWIRQHLAKLGAAAERREQLEQLRTKYFEAAKELHRLGWRP